MGEALAKARLFVKELMGREIEDIPDSDGMRLLKGIPNVDDDKRLDIVIRKMTLPFFRKCLELDPGARVCATGNPGIGKSTSIPYLIRLILERPKPCTVVYQVRGEKWYYQFTSTGDGEYHTEVFSKRVELEDVPSLQDENNFLIVDSGSGTHGSCNPNRGVKAR